MKIKVKDARRIENAIFVTHVTCLLVSKRKKPAFRNFVLTLHINMEYSPLDKLVATLAVKKFTVPCETQIMFITAFPLNSSAVNILSQKNPLLDLPINLLLIILMLPYNLHLSFQVASCFQSFRRLSSTFSCVLQCPSHLVRLDKISIWRRV
jgi:hypothetical protein